MLRVVLYPLDAAAAFLNRELGTSPLGVPWTTHDVIVSAIKNNLRIFGRADRDAEAIARDERGALFAWGCVTRGSLYPMQLRNLQELMAGPDTYLVEVPGDGGRMCRIEDEASQPVVSVGACRVRESDLAVLVAQTRASAAPLPSNVDQPAGGRHRQQERAILERIVDLGYDPQSLPKNEPGKPGVKALVKAALTRSADGQKLFHHASKTVFPHAWDRLRTFGEIRDAVAGVPQVGGGGPVALGDTLRSTLRASLTNHRAFQ